MIGDMFEPRKLTIELSDYELAAVLETTHDGLIRRVKWATTREWNIDFDIAQASIAQLAGGYTRLMFTARDLPEEAFDPNFFKAFNIPPDMWDLINQITYGTMWEDVPVHPHKPGVLGRPPCSLCDMFELA